MKNFLVILLVASALIFMMPEASFSQSDMTTIVNVQQIKMKWPENGSAEERDSLVAIYVDNVIKKNEHILSHRECAHFFTEDNRDYLIIEEYKDLAGMEASFLKTTELEEKAWPDKMKRKEFFDKLEMYFESWHGDHLYRSNPRLSKN